MWFKWHESLWVYFPKSVKVCGSANLLSYLVLDYMRFDSFSYTGRCKDWWLWWNCSTPHARWAFQCISCVSDDVSWFYDFITKFLFYYWYWVIGALNNLRSLVNTKVNIGASLPISYLWHMLFVNIYMTWGRNSALHKEMFNIIEYVYLNFQNLILGN